MADIRWTSANASQLFLCAFVVTLPMATTLKIKEDIRKRKLEEDMTSFLNDLELVLNKSGQRSALFYRD
jgi:hypothetical protein